MTTAQFIPAPHIRSVVHGDRTILLDLRRGRYYSLDEVGTRVWALLGEGADVSAIVDRIGEEFDAPIGVIETDVDVLLMRLEQEMKVIVPVAPTPPPSEPSGWRCAMTLLLATLALRVAGLHRSLALAQRLGRRVRRVVEPTPEFLANVVRKVDTAAAFFPGRALCLEQSLTLYICLRRAGVAAELRIGVQPYPFTAHAWVEHRGELVGTSYDQVSPFVPFERLMEAL
jgi:transglutaminase-like putative cysteine protease